MTDIRLATSITSSRVMLTPLPKVYDTVENYLISEILIRIQQGDLSLSNSWLCVIYTGSLQTKKLSDKAMSFMDWDLLWEIISLVGIT